MLTPNTDQYLLWDTIAKRYSGDKKKNKVEIKWNSSGGKHEITAGVERAYRYDYDGACELIRLFPQFAMVPLDPMSCTWGSHGTWDKHNKRYV